MKKVICFCLAVILMLSCAPIGNAYVREDHDEIMCDILFGQHYNELSKEAITSVKALESAAFLCIDQSGKTGEKDLLVLQEYGVKSLPHTIQEIAVGGGGVHRKHTHMGWRVGAVEKDEDASKWPQRKLILISTCNKIFDDKVIDFSSGTSPKMDAFAALVYYIHILGDHDERKNFDKTPNLIPFAIKNACEENPDIFYELEKYLSIIFEDQSGKRVYKTLMSKLHTQARKARKIYTSNGIFTSEDEFSVYKKQVEELIKTLKDRVPVLLEKEEFFADIFYECKEEKNWLVKIWHRIAA